MSRRAIRIVSQCASADEFLAVFHPYLERDALFIATGSPEAAGARLAFEMTLAGGEPMLKGGGVVLESHRDRSNFYGLRGMKVRFEDLDTESRHTLERLEKAPTRRATSQSEIAGPGRRAQDMIECLIFDEPGSESRDSDVIPIGGEDDVTAVAPPPVRRPESNRDEAPVSPDAGRAPPAGDGGGANRFIVPPPRSEPAISLADTMEISRRAPDDLSSSAPRLTGLSGDSIMDVDSKAQAASAPRGKRRTDARAAAAPPAPPPVPATATEPNPAPPASPSNGEAVSSAAPGSDESIPDRDTADPPSNPPLAVVPTMRMNASGIELRQGSHPPERREREPSSPIVPLLDMATPTEIVQPMSMRQRPPRAPLPPERTEMVRVGHVRTAAVSATLGAMLGVGAGYLLWGLEHEKGIAPALVTSDATTGPADAAPTPSRAPAPAAVSDAGPGEASEPAPERILRIQSIPPGAFVQIDGNPTGKTPVDVKVGTRKSLSVTVRKNGFRPWTKELTGDALDNSVEVVLRKAAQPRRKK